MEDDRPKRTLPVKVKLILYGLLIASLSCFVLLFFMKLFVYKEKSYMYYENNTNIEYSVKLKDNDYYDVKELPSNMNYIASLIDKIPVSFKYNFSSTVEIDYDATYYVEAVTRVYADKDKTRLLYEKSEQLTDEKKVSKEKIKNLSFTESVDIDYGHFNNFISSFVTNYGLNTSSDVTIYFYTKGFGNNKNYEGKANLDSSATVVIPLTEQTINVSINTTDVNKKDTLMERFGLGSIDWLALILFVFLFIADVYVVYMFLTNLVSYTNSFTAYEKELKKILREFDSIIANVNETINFKDYKVINVESFNELVDIHDNVGNPILFKERFKNVEADFIIIDNDVLYKFVLKNNYVDESKYDFEEDVI